MGVQLRWRRDIVDVGVSRVVVFQLHGEERAVGELAFRWKAAVLLAHRLLQSPGQEKTRTHTYTHHNVVGAVGLQRCTLFNVKTIRCKYSRDKIDFSREKTTRS